METTKLYRTKGRNQKKREREEKMKLKKKEIGLKRVKV